MGREGEEGLEEEEAEVSEELAVRLGVEEAEGRGEREEREGRGG